MALKAANNILKNTIIINVKNQYKNYYNKTNTKSTKLDKTSVWLILVKCCFHVHYVFLYCSLFFFPFKAAVVPSAQSLQLTDFYFSDFELSDMETSLCTIRMFTDLNLVQNFQIKHEVRILWYVECDNSAVLFLEMCALFE